MRRLFSLFWCMRYLYSSLVPWVLIVSSSLFFCKFHFLKNVLSCMVESRYYLFFPPLTFSCPARHPAAARMFKLNFTIVTLVDIPVCWVSLGYSEISCVKKQSFVVLRNGFANPCHNSCHCLFQLFIVQLMSFITEDFVAFLICVNVQFHHHQSRLEAKCT